MTDEEQLEEALYQAILFATGKLQDLVLSAPAGELRVHAAHALCRLVLQEGVTAVVSDSWPRERIHAFVDRVVDACEEARAAN